MAPAVSPEEVKLKVLLVVEIVFLIVMVEFLKSKVEPEMERLSPTLKVFLEDKVRGELTKDIVPRTSKLAVVKFKPEETDEKLLATEKDWLPPKFRVEESTVKILPTEKLAEPR
jgi:hypothetical protein